MSPEREYPFGSNVRRKLPNQHRMMMSKVGQPVVEVARAHVLTVVEIEQWKDDFLPQGT